MRIVITGASGFVGQQLVPLLMKSGASLLLVGRSKQKLETIFPQIPLCSYDDIAIRAVGFDALIHLSAANNDQVGSIEQFWDANVKLTVQVISAAQTAGVTRIINFSSIHALDMTNTSFYAETKRAAADAIGEMNNDRIETVYLPLIYGRQWKGKLSVLNRLPKFLGKAFFSVLAALKPSVHVDLLAAYITDLSEKRPQGDAILTDDIGKNFTYLFVKRMTDLFFAIVVALFLGWALVLIWGIIRLQSSGPGLFIQDRVGQHGKVFSCYKFRTMKLGTRQAGTHEITASSVTTLGAFLRKTKIDELPQIWNIICNEMSLIGPRPCLPMQKTLVEARARRGVLDIKPGISGLAQIQNVDMSDPERLAALDARYKSLRCLVLDAKIMLATAVGGGQGDKTR